MTIVLAPIGRVKGGRAEPVDDSWDSVRAVVELDASRCGPAALRGMADFSHAEIVFLLDRVAVDSIERDVRRPRDRPDWPEIGILAQRGRNRPNRLAVSVCCIRFVDGLRLGVEGLDALDGSPVLDIKPVMSGFLPRGAIREPDWAREIMARYWTG